MSGYTKVPNDLLDSMSDLKPAAFKLSMALCRLTHGYHRKSVEASLTDLQGLTGLSRQGIINAAKEIEHLFASSKAGKTTTWLVNTVDQDQSTELTDGNLNGQQSLPDQSTELTDTGQQSLPATSSPKERKYKESLKKDIQFPAELDTPEFAQVWYEWICHRREKEFDDYTPMAIKSLLSQWSEKGQDRTINAIRYSMSRNWASIFEPDSNGNGAKSEYAEEVNDAAGGFNI